MQRLQYVYDDKTENLLDQYTQQLAHYERIFHEEHKHLDRLTYARARDNEPIMTEILSVIERIYAQAIPIALVITDDDDKVTDNGLDQEGPSKDDIKH